MATLPAGFAEATSTTVNDLLAHVASPATLTQAVSNAHNADGTNLSTAQASVGFLSVAQSSLAVMTDEASVVGKAISRLGGGLVLGALVFDVMDAQAQWDQSHYIDESKTASLLADTTALLGLVATATLTGSAAIAAGVVLIPLAAGLGVYAATRDGGSTGALSNALNGLVTATKNMIIPNSQGINDQFKRLGNGDKPQGVQNHLAAIPNGYTPSLMFGVDPQMGGLALGHASIPQTVATPFAAAQKWVFRRDPVTFDLDGDGLETVAASATNPILFDHDADGIKTGTGWVKPDDGFLVLDRNGNGTIDTGRELFGDSTLKSNGQLATDGFDALSDLDSNQDGKISSLDTQYSNLRLWRDLNQDGISDAGELFTLTELGIASINVVKTANSQILPDGNRIADLGTYTRTDGSTGGLGETAQLADIDLTDDTFHRTFTDSIPLTAAAQNLPEMQGKIGERLQTPKPYLEAVNLQVSESGIALDFSAVEVANDVEWRIAV